MARRQAVHRDENRVLGPKSQFGTPLPVEQAFPKGHVAADCDRSLRAMGLDAVDLVQLHLYWPTWGVSGYWMDELQALKRQGKTRFVGIRRPTTAPTWCCRWSRAA